MQPSEMFKNEFGPGAGVYAGLCVLLRDMDV